jgi:hypothetical protein
MTVGQDGQVHFAVLGVTVTTLGRLVTIGA